MPLGFRVSPLWWPALAVASPALVPWLAVKARRFSRGRDDAARVNAERMAAAGPLDLPALRELSL